MLVGFGWNGDQGEARVEYHDGEAWLITDTRYPHKRRAGVLLSGDRLAALGEMLVSIGHGATRDQVDNLMKQLKQKPNSITRSIEPFDRELACIACGCTQNHACQGGCSWVSRDPPKCSRCFLPDGKPRARRAA